MIVNMPRHKAPKESSSHLLNLLLKRETFHEKRQHFTPGGEAYLTNNIGKTHKGTFKLFESKMNVKNPYRELQKSLKITFFHIITLL